MLYQIALQTVLLPIKKTDEKSNTVPEKGKSVTIFCYFSSALYCLKITLLSANRNPEIFPGTLLTEKCYLSPLFNMFHKLIYKRLLDPNREPITKQTL